jgi:radical SAM protein with 4Fe4S-binding SPASM domain
MYYKDKEIEDLNRKFFNDSLHNLIACPRPFMNMVVTAHGDCVLCTLDAPRLTKIGNVYSDSLQEMWSSSTSLEFRKMQLQGRKNEHSLCKDCDWFKLFPQEDCVDGFPIDRLGDF